MMAIEEELNARLDALAPLPNDAKNFHVVQVSLCSPQFRGTTFSSMGVSMNTQNSNNRDQY
jgi:hypothetical protein